MDAVKLMTIHGSKGLEFEAVHVPGLTVSSLPAKPQGQQCPPPVGMIEGSELSVEDEARRAHDTEEECLFFVAASRTELTFGSISARRQSDGKNRSPSHFLSWIGDGLTVEPRNPACLPLPPDAPRPVPIAVTRGPGWHVTDSELVSYEKCPRRFFYTYVLGLRGSRKSTAFDKTHECLYELIAWLAGARMEGEPSLEAAEAALEAIWHSQGPVDHGYAANYRKLASRLVAALDLGRRGA